MKNLKELFKTYNLKTWKQSKFQIFLSIIAISIAVAILVSLKLILALNNSYSIINAKNVNDGDINIAITTNINDEQLNELKKLTDEGKIQYATTYKMQNNFTNGEISNVVNVKFIDSKYSYINKRIGSYAEKLGNNKVLVNKTAADKFELKKGDSISLVPRGFSNSDNKFTVEDIIESTNILDDNLLGVIILNKSDLKADGNINTENMATNINVIVNKNNDLKDIKSELKKSFSNGAHITTYEDGLQANKITDLESKASEFIEMLVIIITGIGISFTTLLLILKRKKDYIVLSIYGMKETMLRDLILYETFLICVIGIILGLSLSFILTGFIEKNIIKDMDIYTLIKASVIPLGSTVLFIIVQTMIFTILPITISKEINPNSILRQQVQKLVFNKDYSSPIFKMIMLITICFSIYIASLKNGVMYVTIILTLIVILYGLAIGGINLIVKMKTTKNKFFMLAIRNIQRQKSRFTFCATALVITLILCGLIINLGYSIIPNIMAQFVDDNGYTVSLSTNFNGENISNTEKVLSKEEYINKYIKTIETTGEFKSLQGKSLQEFIKGQNFRENASNIESSYNNINIEALDISKDMVSYNTIVGRWFNSKDINKNYVILGNNFGSLGIGINDEIALDIKGITYKFIVLGICTRSNFRDNSGIYININTLKNNNFINDSNSKIEYLIQSKIGKEKSLTLSLTKKLNNSLVIDERVKFDTLSKYILQLTYVFIYICCISVFSAICLIGNILMIINYERLSEFLILNVVGAKNRDIRKITIIEGLIIGGVSGIVGCLISELLSYFIITGIFSSKYSPNFIVDLIMIFAAIILTISASLVVINNMKVEKYTELLRAN